jgi:hypothetical protein
MGPFLFDDVHLERVHEKIYRHRSTCSIEANLHQSETYLLMTVFEFISLFFSSSYCWSWFRRNTTWYQHRVRSTRQCLSSMISWKCTHVRLDLSYDHVFVLQSYSHDIGLTSARRTSSINHSSYNISIDVDLDEKHNSNKIKRFRSIFCSSVASFAREHIRNVHTYWSYLKSCFLLECNKILPIHCTLLILNITYK